MTDKPLTKFQQKLEEKRRKQQEQQQEDATVPFADVIPEPESDRSAEALALDAVINGIDIIDAYKRWCAKMTPEVRSGQTEGIKISCPVPGHADANPSAWINTKTQVWFCAKCSQGGDIFDLAAYGLGYPVPGYKEGSKFHELRRKMAESLGYTFIKPPGAKSAIPVGPDIDEPTGEATQDHPELSGEKSDSDSDSDGIVVPISGEPEPPLIFPTLNWRLLVEPDTFLDAYMKCCIIDDIPEEYHFWNGLIALGLAVGRDVTLFDSVPVYSNLFVCLLGNSGDGKSRSFSHLSRLLEKALPADWGNPNDKGVLVLPTPASAEVLIQQFSKPIFDPADPKKVAYYAPVKGLIEFNELSQLSARGMRQGNALKPTLMQFYDAVASVASASVTSGRKEAKDPFGSCFTTTQPTSLKQLVTTADAGSGFLNRWVFASGKQKKRIAVGGARVDVTPAVAPLKAVQAWAGFGKEVGWTTDALERFTDLFDSEIFPTQRSDDSGILGRLDLLFKKLILLLCINEHKDMVDLAIVEKIMVMYPYLLAAFKIPTAEIGNSLYYQIMDEIHKTVEKAESKHKDGASLRDIKTALHRKKFPPPMIVKMIEYLVDTGELEMTLSKPTRGPATARYRHVG